MPASSALTLGKAERLSSRTLIDNLFNGGGSRSMAAFPLRVVYTQLLRKEGEPQARILVSVPKKRFKRAVHRNRVKRQVREAYRHSKHMLPDMPDTQLLIAFIWIDDSLHSSADVHKSMGKLLHRIAERR